MVNEKGKQKALQKEMGYVNSEFFPLRVTEHCSRLPRGVVEPPSLQIFKIPLDMLLCSLI